VLRKGDTFDGLSEVADRSCTVLNVEFVAGVLMRVVLLNLSGVLSIAFFLDFSLEVPLFDS